MRGRLGFQRDRRRIGPHLTASQVVRVAANLGQHYIDALANLTFRRICREGQSLRRLSKLSAWGGNSLIEEHQ